ncbi:RBBP8 N-terminal-like protein isoform X1 [Conger conger]|uniref:RBBP8 N-terminal-like protein isoform X1 n=1 Tax=Conger conger TaxID=82655 RepID=UPI002A5ACC8D|nr:RBBP8 N-terminal-like protein isoform X1 [Conger conger]
MAMALESFTELLHRLKDLHERETEGWQEKVLELTNQKCCSDTKRMEELFNKNQLLREQQRLLTENIKQLENRLRAGLCDRCTVTQDVAKRRQQEYENSQIQSLQHITVLVNEMNALKKENRRLHDEVKNLRGVLDGQSNQDSVAPAPDVSQSPDPSHSAMALNALAMKGSKQPQGGTTLGLPMVKRDPDHNGCATEEKLPVYRKQQSWNGHESQMVHKLHIPAPISTGQRAEQNTVRGPVAGEKRVRSVDSMEPRASPSMPSLPSPSPLVFLKNLPYSSSAPAPSAMVQEKPVRNLLHAPVPYRPRPIKTARLSLPWTLQEQPDWASLGSLCGIGVGPHQTPHLSENNRGLLLAKDLNQNGKRGVELLRADRGAPQLHGAALPLKRAMPAEQAERKDKAEERGPVWWKSNMRQPERIFGENLRDSETDAPLDLSDPGKGKIAEHQQFYEATPAMLEQGIKEEEQSSGRMDTPPHTSTGSSSSSSSPVVHSSPSSACSTSSAQQEQGQHTQEQDTLDQDEAMEGKQDLNLELSANTVEKKVPALTISLHPVVVLEALKPGAEKKDSCDGEMGLELPTENKLEGQSEDGLSSFDMSQNAKRKTRGQFTGREVTALRPRSPKERRVKLSPGWQGKTNSILEQS